MEIYDDSFLPSVRHPAYIQSSGRDRWWYYFPDEELCANIMDAVAAEYVKWKGNQNLE